MATRDPGIDPKCIELAVHFLADSKKADIVDERDLAAAIQDAVEDFFAKHPELNS